MDYTDANGDLVWESDEHDDAIYFALVRMGLVIPTTVEGVRAAEEAMEGQEIELPDSLKDPYEIIRRHPEVFGKVD